MKTPLLVQSEIRGTRRAFQAARQVDLRLQSRRESFRWRWARTLAVRYANQLRFVAFSE